MGESTSDGSARLQGLPRSAIHDLRTPLTSIRGYAQLMLRGVRSEEQTRRAHETIFREAERLGRMLDQLSMVAEALLGGSQPDTVRFDLASLVGRCVGDARARWPEHHFEYEPTVAAPVVADPRRIEEALASVLDNAAGFSPSGSRVRVSLERESDRARVSIEDQGIGIPPDELEGVFACFSRGSNVAGAPSSPTRGLGVGLFLARAASEEAGGELTVESELDVRSTFHLTLPLAS